MSAIRLLGAAIVLIAAITHAAAQQVISEPGYCAFFYPNANCQNKGPGNPYTDPYAQRGMAPHGQTVGVAVKRPKKPAAAVR
jgi:hypothetical protein